MMLLISNAFFSTDAMMINKEYFDEKEKIR
jgi:hypothetical protein